MRLASSIESGKASSLTPTGLVNKIWLSPQPALESHPTYLCTWKKCASSSSYYQIAYFSCILKPNQQAESVNTLDLSVSAKSLQAMGLSRFCPIKRGPGSYADGSKPGGYKGELFGLEVGEHWLKPHNSTVQLPSCNSPKSL